MPAKCPYCGATFRTKRGLSQHIRQSHPVTWEINQFVKELDETRREFGRLIFGKPKTTKRKKKRTRKKSLTGSRRSRTPEILASPSRAKIIKLLKEFEAESIRDEEDLEKQVYQYLVAKGLNVERQVQLPDGSRVDLRIGKCLMEIKVARNNTVLKRLIGQIVKYRDMGECIVAFIAVPPNKVEQIDKKLLNYLKKELRTLVVLKQVPVRKRRRRLR